MAKRCGTKKCRYPRARWWKATMGVDWYGSGGGEEPVDPVNQQLFDAFETRVLADGGTVEGEECIVDRITYLRGLGFWDDASLVLIPGAVKANKIYSIVPTNGTGDFAFTRAGAKTRRGVSALTALATGVPSIDYSRSQCPALKLEPAKTNLALASEEFDDSDWTKEFTTVSANAITAPDGVSTADNIFETTDNNVHRVRQTFVKAGSILRYTFTVYAKAGGRSWVALQCQDGTNRAGKNFDLTNGTVGLTRLAGSLFNLINSAITPVIDWATGVPSGWFRCEITVETPTTTALIAEVFLATGDNVVTYAGDITKNVYLWGAQVELSTYASSYIPTTTASVAKVADLVTALTSVSALIGQTAGTVYFEMSSQAETTIGPAKNISLSDGTANNRIRISFSTSNTIVFEVTQGGVLRASISFPYISYVTYRIAIVYANNLAQLFVNGVKIGEDLVVTVPTCSRISFDDGTGSSPFAGLIKSINVYKTAFSDASAISLTSLQLGSLISATVTQTTNNVLDLVFSAAVDITTTGWSVINAAADIYILSVVSGGGTTTPKFLLSRSVIPGETIVLSYNPGLGGTTLVSGGAEIAAVPDLAVTNNVHINLINDFTGITVDTAKLTVSNPGSANLTISQNNNLRYVRTTDTAIAGENSELAISVLRFTRGVFAAKATAAVGYVNSIYFFRFQFNSTNWISIQNAAGVWRLIIKVANVNVYDLTTAISSTGPIRVKIVYDTSNNVSYYYWSGSAWTQMGTTQVANIGADGVSLFASTSDSADAIGDRVEFDEQRVTDQDYTTELPENFFL